MATDKQIGALILVASVFGILVYGWLVFFQAPLLVLEVTVFAGVALVLGILAWIGYTMATTPPPEPIENLKADVDSNNLQNQAKQESKEKN